MPLHLEVEDDQVELLKEIYANKWSEINMNMTRLQSELQRITPMLVQLGLKSPRIAKGKTENGSLDFLSQDYSPSFTWEQKAMYVLNKRGELTAKQIVDIIGDEYEPGMDKAKALNSLPATMSVSYSNSKLERRKNDAGEFIYSMINRE